MQLDMIGLRLVLVAALALKISCDFGGEGVVAKEKVTLSDTS